METLSVRTISLTYPGLYSDQAVIALKGVNLTVKSGDFVVALGASRSDDAQPASAAGRRRCST